MRRSNPQLHKKLSHLFGWLFFVDYIIGIISVMGIIYNTYNTYSTYKIRHCEYLHHVA